VNWIECTGKRPDMKRGVTLPSASQIIKN